MKSLTEELIENTIVYIRDNAYSLNKFRLNENYLATNNLLHLSQYSNQEILFNQLKSEGSFLIRRHDSYSLNSCCDVCYKETAFMSWYTGYKKYCSKSCETHIRNETIRGKSSKEYEDIYEKRKNTNLQKYGVENTMQLKEFQERSVHTQNTLYGGTFNIEKSRQTKLERYGDANFNNPNKQQKTCVANSYLKYGFRHYSQTGNYSMERFKWKEYQTPNNNILRIQGYEHYLLDELLLEYSEDEILTSRKDMHEIWYLGLDGKQHRYFPDVYIPITNTIYEVKSEWTLNIDLETNNLKFQSVKDAGYNFVLKVY